MDRVIAYNIVLAHIPGKANAAADFLSRMQTDPNESLELQLVDSIPMKQLEINMKAKTPDVAMLAIESVQEIEAKPAVPKDLIEKIQSNDALQHLIPNLNEILKSASNDQTPELYAIKRATEINSIQEKDPMNFFQVSSLNSKALDIETEQKKDPVLRKVMTWIDTGCNDDLTYASLEFRKYYKHLTRLQMQKGILVRQFFDDVGKISHYQICVVKHLKKEVVYRIHNSPTAGNLGIVRTAKEFRQRFYFPGFTEFLTDYIKNCLSYSTLKRVSKRQINPPLQPISSEQLLPGDMMQIDSVGPFQSPVYKYVLSGIDVFSKYLFAIPLTSAHAGGISFYILSTYLYPYNYFVWFGNEFCKIAA